MYLRCARWTVWSKLIMVVQLINDDANVLALERKSGRGLLHVALATYTKDLKRFQSESVKHPLTNMVKTILGLESLDPYLEDKDSAFNSQIAYIYAEQIKAFWRDDVSIINFAWHLFPPRVHKLSCMLTAVWHDAICHPSANINERYTNATNQHLFYCLGLTPLDMALTMKDCLSSRAVVLQLVQHLKEDQQTFWEVLNVKVRHHAIDTWQLACKKTFNSDHIV